VPLHEAAPKELMALSASAHWNQNEDDWRTMLALGRGWGLRQRDPEGRDILIASTLVLPYGGEAIDRFAWVSMVLVLPGQRGQGHAQRLLRIALDDLRAQGLQPVLDATPAGRPVYLKEGFVDTWTFTRWRRPAGALVVSRDSSDQAAGRRAAVRPLLEGDWPLIERLDAPAFGASRVPLLRELARRAPTAAWVAERGYVLGRPGRTALQLGPLVVEDGDDSDEAADVALPLLAAALRGCADEAARRDIVVDLRDERDERDGRDGREPCAAWLRAQGFVPERPFTRMVHGAQAKAGEKAKAKAPGDAGRVVLVAGPELG